MSVLSLSPPTGKCEIPSDQFDDEVYRFVMDSTHFGNSILDSFRIQRFPSARGSVSLGSVEPDQDETDSETSVCSDPGHPREEMTSSFEPPYFVDLPADIARFYEYGEMEMIPKSHLLEMTPNSQHLRPFRRLAFTMGTGTGQERKAALEDALADLRLTQTTLPHQRPTGKTPCRVSSQSRFRFLHFRSQRRAASVTGASPCTSPRTGGRRSSS
jgi:hypothetical protein